MMKVITGKKVADSKLSFKYCYIEVNGVQVTRDASAHSKPIIFRSNSSASDLVIFRHLFNEMPDEALAIHYHEPFVWPDPENVKVRYSVSIEQDEGKSFFIEINIVPNLPGWKSPYSPSEWLDSVKSLISSHYLPVFSVREPKHRFGFNELSFLLKHQVEDAERPIDETCSPVLEELREVFATVTTRLDEEARPGTLATYFSFPIETRSACEQYLLYFGEFLRDLGIENSVELKEEAGRVLFSVTPTSKDQALSQIREALDTYLDLPAVTIVSAADNEYRLEAQRLEANVMHLKSQLLLTHAMLEAKQAVINAHQERIDYQRQIIEGRVLQESKQEQTEKHGDKEEILDGTVAIVPFKGKGFEVNLPKLFRMLKDKIQGKDVSSESEEVKK